MRSNEIEFRRLVWRSAICSIGSMAVSAGFAGLLTIVYRATMSSDTAVSEALRVVNGLNLEPIEILITGMFLLSVAFSLVNRRLPRLVGLAASKRVEAFITTTVGIICGVFGALGFYELCLGYLCHSCSADPNALPVLARVLIIWLQGCGLLLLLSVIRHSPMLMYGPIDAS